MTEAPARYDRDQAPAARLGAELMAARRNLGWELPQLAGSLRIRQSYLEAIENGRIGELPGTTYALGFVRAYATALGLPGEDMARRFRAEAENVNGKPALHFPAPVPRRGVPAGALMLLGIVILATAYGGWYWVTEHRATPVETVPPIPDRLAGQAPAPAALAPSPQVASLLPSTAPPAVRTEPAARPPAPVAAAPQPQPAAPKPALAPLAVPPPSLNPPAPVSPTQGPATPSVTAAPPPAAPAPAGTRIVIKTSADAWITVKQPNGPAVLNKMLHAGDTWPVPADKTGLTLTTGNAGATELDVDGAPIPVSLGTPGMVRRNVPLDADKLKAGDLPAAKARGAKPA